MVARRIMKRGRAQGAAIMLALWALFLLSAMVISWALDIDTRLTISGNANRVIEATAMASSGAEIAFHPNVKPGAPVLKGSLGPSQSFEAQITGEGGRLDLNKLVAGEVPARLELLRKYLEIKGVDLNERDYMIDCLLDWVDPDNLVRLNGAEDEPGYKPANKFLMSLDEVKRISGWEEFTSTPDWNEDFTLHSSTGQIDINWASRDILLALPGMTDLRVNQFLSIRRGPDDLQGTEDDVDFAGPSEVQVALGFSQEQFNQLAGLLVYKDPVLRVESVGKSGPITRTVRMVFGKTGNSILLKSWKEF